MIHTTALKTLSEIALVFPAFIIIFTFKGFFRSLIAKLVGDNTAEEEGFLTLNPLAHIDLNGVLILLGVLVGVTLLFSGMLPRGFLILLIILLGVRLVIQIPIDESRFRSYRIGGVATSLADFMASIILSIATIIVMKYLFAIKLPSTVVVTFLELCDAIIDLSIMLGVLSLIPLPPFDGGRLIKYLLPSSYDYIFAWLEEYAFFIVLILFFLPGVSTVFWGILSGAATYIKHLLFSLFLS